MMTRNLMIGLGVGLVVVAIVVMGTLVTTKGGHLTLTGKVLKVRTLGTDERNSIIVADFRATNQAQTPFMSREAKLILTKADGTEVEGDTIAQSDMDRVFDYYKILGPKFNPVLVQRDRIKGSETIDRMVAASFPVPEAEVQQRKNLTVRLFDVDGPEFDIKEK